MIIAIIITTAISVFAFWGRTAQEECGQGWVGYNPFRFWLGSIMFLLLFIVTCDHLSSWFGYDVQAGEGGEVILAELIAFFATRWLITTR